MCHMLDFHNSLIPNYNTSAYNGFNQDNAKITALFIFSHGGYSIVNWLYTETQWSGLVTVTICMIVCFMTLQISDHMNISRTYISNPIGFFRPWGDFFTLLPRYVPGGNQRPGFQTRHPSNRAPPRLGPNLDIANLHAMQNLHLGCDSLWNPRILLSCSRCDISTHVLFMTFLSWLSHRAIWPVMFEIFAFAASKECIGYRTYEDIVTTSLTYRRCILISICHFVCSSKIHEEQ